jgi:N-acetylmuramoyl-L-alanine amidase
MTREKDVYIGLYERADYANALNADLFLSIHHNAASPSAHGVLTVYDGSVMPSKTAFAKTIQNAAYQGLGAKNMGLQNRPAIVVTRETKMPSALPEMGFMTNPNELELLKQNSYRQKSAQALFNGIKTYVDTQM